MFRNLWYTSQFYANCYTISINKGVFAMVERANGGLIYLISKNLAVGIFLKYISIQIISKYTSNNEWLKYITIKVMVIYYKIKYYLNLLLFFYIYKVLEKINSIFKSIYKYLLKFKHIIISIFKSICEYIFICKQKIKLNLILIHFCIIYDPLLFRLFLIISFRFILILYNFYYLDFYCLLEVFSNSYDEITSDFWWVDIRKTGDPLLKEFWYSGNYQFKTGGPGGGQGGGSPQGDVSYFTSDKDDERSANEKKKWKVINLYPDNPHFKIFVGDNFRWESGIYYRFFHDANLKFEYGIINTLNKTDLTVYDEETYCRFVSLHRLIVKNHPNESFVRKTLELSWRRKNLLEKSTLEPKRVLSIPELLNPLEEE
uniref:hypothetical protein n=1 Tax=Aspergillus sclerotioniger TaxID=319627 RepID=UPI002114F455|nr:hypothetical protein NQV51_mgp19 [Aspergillus sclerotioniger]USH57635.1 hypothetical protein [Aspergillus sclerotioniger]